MFCVVLMVIAPLPLLWIATMPFRPSAAVLAPLVLLGAVAFSVIAPAPPEPIVTPVLSQIPLWLSGLVLPPVPLIVMSPLLLVTVLLAYTITPWWLPLVPSPPAVPAMWIAPDVVVIDELLRMSTPLSSKLLLLPPMPRSHTLPAPLLMLEPTR